MPVYPGAPDRLDPPPQTVGATIPVLVDERHYLGSRGSSSRAKKADAALRISFARRSSRFSRSNSAIRSASFVVTPERRPPSTSAWWTQFRYDSGLIPNW